MGSYPFGHFLALFNKVSVWAVKVSVWSSVFFSLPFFWFGHYFYFPFGSYSSALFCVCARTCTWSPFWCEINLGAAIGKPSTGLIIVLGGSIHCVIWVNPRQNDKSRARSCRRFYSNLDIVLRKSIKSYVPSPRFVALSVFELLSLKNRFFSFCRAAKKLDYFIVSGDNLPQ